MRNDPWIFKKGVTSDLDIWNNREGRLTGKIRKKGKRDMEIIKDS